MKFEVGMYCRIDGYIGKICNINGFREPRMEIAVDIPGIEDVMFTDRNTIEKTSYNIRDLIETGDLMYIDISPDNYGGIVVPRVAETEKELEKWKERFDSGECILKTFLTKEQIVNNWYEVEREGN